MTKTVLISALLLSVAGQPSLADGITSGIKLSGTCKLVNKPVVDASGPCSVLQEGAVVSVQGTVAENDRHYIATIDNDKNTGLLIGAGTFLLADGELSKNETFEVRWPNGYVLMIELDK